MMIDYAPVVRRSFPGYAQTGLGEFFAIPIFTCAGLMYLVSAIDFVFIFVSLELVTISFYVLVSFTRRNPVTLEAGMKYLVLSAVSTAFLVYGIAWIFGVTGQTNLHRITQRAGESGCRSRRGAARHGAGSRRAWFQDCCGAIPNLGAGCLSRRAHAGNCVSLGWFEGGGFRRAATSFTAVPDAAANAAADRSDRAAHIDLRKSRGAAADEPETATCLFQHRACGLSADRSCLFRCPRGYFLSGGLLADDPSEFRGFDNRRAANRRRNFRF